ncbi:hypothetical protein EVAR_92204_1 [Eumeta japonica]|uniref:Uncharacterized protein n=1 Tax=Eumeta variegata TaxID=151549 RepID=A0A4C1TLU9_EUMVA|nr:hypothetical protein EVAR_92204_1 [Eumeta japonica]
MKPFKKRQERRVIKIIPIHAECGIDSGEFKCRRPRPPPRPCPGAAQRPLPSSGRAHSKPGLNLGRF